MKLLKEFLYDRVAAVAYANKWAYRRNPDYYDFENIGGDCTNFANQCILAGTGVMNYTETYGWYYVNLDYRSPSWTGVEYLYNFLVTNKGIGPFAEEISLSQLQLGDVCQLFMDQGRFQHTPVVTEIGDPPTQKNVLIAAHSNDANCRPLDTYNFKKIRYLHILGYRWYEE